MTETDPPDGARSRPPRHVRVAAAALVVALVGLVAVLVASWQPWVRVELPAFTERRFANQLGSYDQDLTRILDLPTATVRWLAIGGLLLSLVLLRPERTRRLAGVPAMAAGAAAIVVALRGTREVAVSTGGASIERGTAVWVVVVGGAVAIVAGLVATLARSSWRPLPAAPVAAGAVVLGLVGGALVAVPEPTEPVRRDPFEVVIDGDSSNELLWGVAATATRVADLSDSPRRESLVGVDLDGGPGVWVLQDTNDEAWVVGELQDGRLLPRTRVRSERSDRLSLVGVIDGDALVLVVRGSASAVVRISLDRTEVRLPASFTPGGKAPTGVAVLFAVPATDLERMVYDVTPQADGSVLVAVDHAAGRSLAHRIAPAVVRSGDPWTLGAGVDLRNSNEPVAFDRDGRLFQVVGGPVGGGKDEQGEVTQVSTSVVVDQRGNAVFGGAVGLDCGISRDPFAVSIRGVYAMAIDGAGNRWYALRDVGGSDAETRLVVQEPDGTVLLAGTRVRSVTSIVAAPDGSVWITAQTSDGRQALRVDDPRAFVADLDEAPVRRAGCPPDQTIRLATTGGSVIPSSAAEFEGTVIDLSGRTLVASELPGAAPPANRLVLRGRRDTEDVADRRTDGPVAADGRGGAWWVDAAVDPTGATRPILVHRVLYGPETRTVLPGTTGPKTLAVDPEDGSVLFDLADGRFRVAIGGSPEPLAAGPELGEGDVLLGGAGDAPFAVLADRQIVRLVPGEEPEPWLGGPDGTDLRLDQAVQQDGPVASYPVAGAFLGPDGLPWVLAGGYLARLTGPGEIELVVGPEERLPPGATDPHTLSGAVLVQAGGQLFNVLLDR